MDKKGVKKKERLIWHSHFQPALILGMAIIVSALLFDFLSGAGIIMLASIAASAVILTHKYRHHLTTLGTITSAYILGSILAIILIILLRLGYTPINAQVFIVLFVIGGLLYWLNLFHPPAVAFAMAFTIFERGIISYLFVLFAVIVLFIIVRLAIYIVHEHLTIKDFVYEFIREEERLIKEEEKKVKKGIKKI